MILKLTSILSLAIFGCTPPANQALEFDDPKFEKTVLAVYPDVDMNKDGQIDKTEAEAVKELHLLGQV